MYLRINANRITYSATPPNIIVCYGTALCIIEVWSHLWSPYLFPEETYKQTAAGQNKVHRKRLANISENEDDVGLKLQALKVPNNMQLSLVVN